MSPLAARRIVVLTGAGISAESGIKTFRAADGLWEEHRIEDVATPEGFAANPARVQQFYNGRRRQLLSAAVQVNPAHRALAELEAQFDGDFLLVTQNIDDLHERAGSADPVHMHGELLKMHCSRSGQVFSIAGDIDPERRCDCCQQSGTLRPHVVWFGEMPLQMPRIEAALSRCDLFIAVGTSGNVYPAAGFVQLARRAGAYSIEVNLEASSQHSYFDEHRHGLASEQLPRLCEQILAARQRLPSARE